MNTKTNNRQTMQKCSVTMTAYNNAKGNLSIEWLIPLTMPTCDQWNITIISNNAKEQCLEWLSQRTMPTKCNNAYNQWDNAKVWSVKYYNEVKYYNDQWNITTMPTKWMPYI